jgi:hypothetical protein
VPKTKNSTYSWHLDSNVHSQFDLIYLKNNILIVAMLTSCNEIVFISIKSAILSYFSSAGKKEKKNPLFGNTKKKKRLLFFFFFLVF